jgi:hypothetical protein
MEVRMKKATYRIRILANKKTRKLQCSALVEGYTFEVDGITFGVTNKSHTGEKLHHWPVTEVSTGLLVTRCDRRCDAINMVTPFVDKIKMILKPDENSIDSIPKLEDSI